MVRCAMASSLVTSHGGIADIVQTTSLATIAAMILGGLLLAGLWTPLTAVAAAMIQLWSGLPHQGLDAETFIVAATLVALAMLGPGSWSIDAIIFGRKRIDIGRRSDAPRL